MLFRESVPGTASKFISYVPRGSILFSQFPFWEGGKCDASGTWASWPTGGLTSTTMHSPPHISVPRYITLCMSAQGLVSPLYKPGQHLYLVLIISCLLLIHFFVYLFYYYSGYEPSFVQHTTRDYYTSTLYPRSSYSLTCATLHRGHSQVSQLKPIRKSYKNNINFKRTPRELKNMK